MHFYIWMMWLLLQVLYQVIGIQGWIGIEETICDNKKFTKRLFKIKVYAESCLEREIKLNPVFA